MFSVLGADSEAVRKDGSHLSSQVPDCAQGATGVLPESHECVQTARACETGGDQVSQPLTRTQQGLIQRGTPRP